MTEPVETRFKCKTCEKVFKRDYDRARHMHKKVSCAKIEPVDDTKCAFCKKTFSTKGNAKQHIARCKHRTDMHTQILENQKTLMALTKKLEDVERLAANCVFTTHIAQTDPVSYINIKDQSHEYIYLVAESPYADRVKIGRSVNVVQRLSTLQTGNGTRLYVHAVTVKPIAVNHEHTLHKRFHNRRLIGEWFRFTWDELELLSSGMSD